MELAALEYLKTTLSPGFQCNFLVLVQPRKTRPCVTERLLMGPLQTVWTQIRTDKMSVLIWIQTVCNSDSVPESIF